ncbi:hypothetical protein D3874_01430 [Oleomonas cavernae]|uniref:DUF2134 domain-containing protein n=1 Tax=Oleomonas cavernae TaxID=2320859 RepID=A0A418WTH5_9PROT|nr:TadG family pilus assembly protein [Oleomonas cavernae]RJF94525.1 hypothetical protein D3874_01430 [Oleomonas cavernae]
MGTREPKRPIWERGAAALVFMVAMPVLIGTLSMVVDLGYAFHAKQSLQDTLDLAAIAAARHLDGGTGGTAGAVAAAQVVLTDNGYGTLALTQACVDPTADDQVTFCLGTYDSHKSGGGLVYPVADRFTAGGTNPRAVRLSGRGSSPSFFAGALGVTDLDVSARATSAFVGSPLAMLTIRSTLVHLDSSQGTVLNAVFGGLLGGNLNLSLVSWQGLIDTDINLLDFVDELAIGLHLDAGGTDQVLSTDAAVGTVLQAAIDALERDGGSAINATAIDGLADLQAIVPAGQTMRLGSILSLASGTPAAGMDATLSVFDLTQAIVQAANGENGLAASIPLDLGDNNTVTLRLSVVEPPQLSAIGNPELAKANPFGPNQIYVRTAQVRAVVSLELAGLTGIANLASKVANLVAPVTTLLNDLFHLDLVTVIGSLLGVPHDMVDIIIVPGDPVRIDVSLDLGAGKARVTDFNCPPNSKPESLTIAVKTAIANLRIGQVDLDSIFSPISSPASSRSRWSISASRPAPGPRSCSSAVRPAGRSKAGRGGPDRHRCRGHRLGTYL